MKRPNILLAISDDQSWPHASAYGCRFVNTPVFDRVAAEGLLFTHAYCPAPQCSPSRAALLTGRNIWQLEEAGSHASSFPSKFKVYPDILEEAGYFVGYTGKPWSPGSWEAGGRSHNPSGSGTYNDKTCRPPTAGISDCDYAANFKQFLDERPSEVPFCFWYGCREPHRIYEAGSGLRAGKKLEDVDVPGYLPDEDIVRSDLLDYAFEIEWYDRHLGLMLAYLEEIGELDNTLIIATSDNGMPFPRAKANLYENSTRVPLAIRWGTGNPAGISGPGRRVDDFVSFIDFAPTFLEAAGLPVPLEMEGRGLMDIFTGQKSDRQIRPRDYILTGRERHTHARRDNVGYPIRSIRTYDYLYIRNFKPERWPMGPPDGFYDVDGSPTKTYIIENKNEENVKHYYSLAFDKRQGEELYDTRTDPYCLENIAAKPEYAKVKRELSQKLNTLLTRQKDPRLLGTGDIFESYPRFITMRPELGGFAEQGKYNPAFQGETE